MKKHAVLIAVFLSGSLLLTSCGGDNKEEKEAGNNSNEKPDDQDPDDLSDDMEDEFEDESDEVEFIMPSPLQVADLLNSSGLKWTDGVTNPVDNLGQYTTEFKKSLNFGVYSMDLAYAVINDKTSESEKYLQAVRELAIETGLDEIFNSEDLVNKLDQNLGNKEEFMPLLVEIQERTDMVLDEKDAKHKTVIHFAGAWIEGMYIGTKTADSKDNTKLGMAVVNQMVILENIIKGLNSYPEQSEEIKTLAADLQGMLDAYYGLESVKEIENSEFLDPTLTNEELEKLSGMIESLRQKTVTI